jgi:glycosyltransferase involved in cell wall biosynthesis
VVAWQRWQFLSFGKDRIGILPTATLSQPTDGHRMPGRRSRVHCELGPVLINRTAVYKICKAMPGELSRRGFRVHCSALLAGVAQDARPHSPWEKQLFRLSRRWLDWAITRPRLFNTVRSLTGLGPRWRHRRGVSLYLDPLYTLFYGAPDSGVVMVYDITPVSMEGWHHPHVSWLYGRAFDQLARSRCHLVATCQNTADQLRANWGMAPQRLTVLPLGLFSLPAAKEAMGAVAGEPYLLFVGSFEPRKNIAGLISAYAASGLHAARGIGLKIIGSLPPPGDPVLTLARSTPGVTVMGFVTDAELAAAYEHCLAFVYPSFCEGFGLPLLEAMHHGCICLSTNLGASPEIAEAAALYVDPYSPEDLTRGLREVAALSGEQRQRLAARARQRALQFTWERFYDGLADVIRNHVT